MHLSWEQHVWITNSQHMQEKRWSNKKKRLNGWIDSDKMGLDIYFNFSNNNTITSTFDGMYLSLIVYGFCRKICNYKNGQACAHFNYKCRGRFYIQLYVFVYILQCLAIPYDITNHGICCVVHSFQIKCFVEFHIQFASRPTIFTSISCTFSNIKFQQRHIKPSLCPANSHSVLMK